jgi:hypothetical protein
MTTQFFFTVNCGRVSAFMSAKNINKNPSCNTVVLKHQVHQRNEGYFHVFSEEKSCRTYMNSYGMKMTIGMENIIRTN